MDLNAHLEAAMKNAKGPVKKRHARKGNQSTAEFLLQETKAAVRELDPNLDPESPEFRTPVILIAAAFVVGPRVDMLVEFTGYPFIVVADIARRMRASGLWDEDGASTDQWFKDDTLTAVFWADCAVADGLLRIYRNKDGVMEYDVARDESRRPI